MKNIGLFYGTSTVKTAAIAEKIQQAFGEDKPDLIPIEQAWKSEFETYEHLIVGVSTWFDGELPTYWDEILPELKTLTLKNKTVAIFGLGDQVNYPDNFADGIGILSETFEQTGATLIGFTSPEGYTFNRSRAMRADKLVGLVIDVDNQSDKTDERIKNWVAQLKSIYDKKKPTR
jgi:flavodoxin I